MTELAIRFSIAEGDFRSASWKIWSPSSKEDIYIACRELRGTIKASLHESGDWHIAYRPDTFESKVRGVGPQEQDRFIQKWDRPEPIAPGFTLAFRIVTPSSSVATLRSIDSDEVTFIPNCPKGKATEVDVIVTSSETRVSTWPGERGMGTKLIGSYSLSSNDVVWAVYHVVDMPDLSSISQGRGYFYKGVTKEDLAEADLRAMVIAQESDGFRVIYDVSVEHRRAANPSPDCVKSRSIH